MGCGISQDIGKIHRTTAIEILDEKDYKLNPSNVVVAKFRTNGQKVKVHFRTICPRLNSKVS